MNREKSYELSAIFAAFLVGLIIRLLPARNALVNGDVLFYGYDTYYHIRRIFYTMDHFPHDLWFDSYLNYPYGHVLRWPPLFDQMIAGASLLLGADSQHSVELIAALMPPILGAVTILAVYCLAKELFETRVALLSAFLMAIASWHVSKTRFGYTDHHVLEALFMAGIILFMVLSLSKKEGRHLFAVLAGVLMAALAYTWTGAPGYLGFFLLYAVVQLSLDIKKGISSKETIYALMVAFGAALLLMLPFWDHSWLMLSFFAAAGVLVATLLLYLLSRLFVTKGVNWIIFTPLVAILAYASLMAVCILDTSLYSQLLTGVGYFFGADFLSQVVWEAMPLYMTVEPLSFLGLGLVLGVAGMVAMVHQFLRSGARNGQLLFLVWALFTLVISIAQTRFLYLFFVNMSVLLAFLFFWVLNWMNRTDRLKSEALSKAVPLVLLAVVVLSIGEGNPLSIAESQPPIAGPWADSLKWLEENSPPTSYFSEPSQTPEYSIFTWWDYGNWILYKAQRPVVANNFQAGAVESSRFYLSENEMEALSILDKRGSRYVITDASMLNEILPAMAVWIGEHPTNFVYTEREGKTMTYHHPERFRGTTLAGLHLFDCNGMGHLRLVYESYNPNQEDSLSEVKIFERVAGAKITGTTQPDQPVGVILNMTSNQGRSFQYFNYAPPQNGRYQITVPYSTEDRYETRSTGPYWIFSGGEMRVVEVSEDDVLQEKEIEVNF